jgi:hypothetical protein
MKKESRALRWRSRRHVPYTEPSDLAAVEERKFMQLAEPSFSEWNSAENEKQFRDL